MRGCLVQGRWCPRRDAGTSGMYAADAYQGGGQAWVESEAPWLTERRSAMTRAAGWSVPFAVVMLLSAYVVAGIARSRYIESGLGASRGDPTVPHPPPPYLLWLLLAGTVCWVACAMAEVLLARTFAGRYPSSDRGHGFRNRPFRRPSAASSLASTASSATSAVVVSPSSRWPSSGPWWSSVGRYSLSGQ